ncbi:hypothetical protein HanRHA438_Chr04g0193321 [Helianthus annuus]|nr:hypothetical protein HanRHA438_Chr04g0193321 [Helianthus annuus]
MKFLIDKEFTSKVSNKKCEGSCLAIAFADMVSIVLKISGEEHTLSLSLSPSLSLPLSLSLPPSLPSPPPSPPLPPPLPPSLHTP